ncbi:MAG: xanthine dehydrogenase accessory protein XdhC [Caldimonas sp.]
MKSPGGPAIVVEVAATRGSAPRDAGTRMLVSAEAIRGTIGGGHLELKAISFARAMLAHHDLSRHERHYALGPSLGQCCGGDVTLAFSPLEAHALAHWPVSAPLFHLQMHGAGHVGRAIATLLATLDCEVDWFDERDDIFPAATGFGSPWPAHIRRVCVDTIEAEVRHAPAGAFHLVLTHEHALDLRIAEAILSRGDFAFFGLIGSKTKRATFSRRLAERGIAPERIARMTCPIGVAGIAGKAPEVIAAAVVAQLLVEHGRAGMPTMPSHETTFDIDDRADPDAAGVDGGHGARVLAAARHVRRGGR